MVENLLLTALPILFINQTKEESFLTVEDRSAEVKMMICMIWIIQDLVRMRMLRLLGSTTPIRQLLTIMPWMRLRVASCQTYSRIIDLRNSQLIKGIMVYSKITFCCQKQVPTQVCWKLFIIARIQLVEAQEATSKMCTPMEMVIRMAQSGLFKVWKCTYEKINNRQSENNLILYLLSENNYPIKLF